MDARLQVLSTHQRPHKCARSCWFRVSDCAAKRYFNYNLTLTENLKIIKRHLIKATFNPIQDQGTKRPPPTSFSRVTFINVRISP